MSPGCREPSGDRGLLFGSAAERYERYRPGYPDELVDVVLRYADRPVRTALEVGAGTGKATRVFASRGIGVTALEPDAAMAQVLGTTTSRMTMEVVPTTFEHLDTARRFDLVYAAASWHWTEPATRWARAAELLVSGGVLALFGSPTALVDPALAAAVKEIEQQTLPADAHEPGNRWTMAEMVAAEGFGDAVRQDLRRTTMMTVPDFVGRLSTVSAYLVLAPDARVQALHRVAAILPDRFEVDTTVKLALTRRV